MVLKIPRQEFPLIDIFREFAYLSAYVCNCRRNVRMNENNGVFGFVYLRRVTRIVGVRRLFESIVCVNDCFFPLFQVTSSCSSVYVDGSEIRGSSNATILVKYETFTGTASFLVWMPEISELDIAISDVKLSQIYDWIVPDNAQR